MWLWAAFIIFILFLLVVDLGVFHRKAQVITLKEALTWSGVWIGVALVFNLVIYFTYQYHWFGLDIPEAEPDGRTAAVLFFTGYIVEKWLGVDNVFIIAMIFSYFRIPRRCISIECCSGHRRRSGYARGDDPRRCRAHPTFLIESCMCSVPS
jgi:tellurite resistance protein TerC